VHHPRIPTAAPDFLQCHTRLRIQGCTRTLALELGPFGINVNAIAPGFIVTDLTDATARRVGVEPEAYREAAAAAFLCRDEASYVTGQTLYVDGGAKIGPAGRETAVA
jgi:3-oxoacyl-[acyl-carrier protein] reductase